MHPSNFTTEVKLCQKSIWNFGPSLLKIKMFASHKTFSFATVPYNSYIRGHLFMTFAKKSKICSSFLPPYTTIQFCWSPPPRGLPWLIFNNPLLPSKWCFQVFLKNFINEINILMYSYYSHKYKFELHRLVNQVIFYERLM